MMSLSKSRNKPDPVIVDACESCRYYQEAEDLEDDDRHDPDTITGVCRRYPPVTIPGVDTVSVYPEVVGSTGWCGEFTPRS